MRDEAFLLRSYLNTRDWKKKCEEPQEASFIECLIGGKQLTDDVISEACRILAGQFPTIVGFIHQLC